MNKLIPIKEIQHEGRTYVLAAVRIDKERWEDLKQFVEDNSKVLEIRVVEQIASKQRLN